MVPETEDAPYEGEGAIPQRGQARSGVSTNRLQDRFDNLALHSVRSPVGQLAAAVTEIESLILKRDAAVRIGELAVVADLERLEQDLRAADIANFLSVVHDAAKQAAESDLMPRISGAGDVSSDASRSGMSNSFRLVETHLLQVAGLAGSLADAHVRSAMAAFVRQDWGYSLNKHSFHQASMSRFREGRDAVCQYAQHLAAKQRDEQESRLARNRMRLVARVTGGVLIGGVNVSAAVLFGDFVGAVSTVLGAAASSIGDELLRAT